MPGIVVSFIINTTVAMYCTVPTTDFIALEFQQQVLFTQWSKNRPPGLTPPNIIMADHANYTGALKTCKPYP